MFSYGSDDSVVRVQLAVEPLATALVVPQYFVEVAGQLGAPPVGLATALSLSGFAVSTILHTRK